MTYPVVPNPTELTDFFHLIYVSTASEFFTPKDLNQIIQCAHKHNYQKKVTGILLHQRNHFLQFLEGEELAVWALKERIEKDRRHRDMKIIMTEKSTTRHFEKWTMACPDLNLPKLKNNPALADIYSSSFEINSFMKEPEKWRDLLLFFRRVL